MQAGILMLTYVATVVVVHSIGFLISRVVAYSNPAFGLTTFLVLFLASFGIAWPIALRLAEFGLRRAGYVIETADKRAV